MQTQIHRYDVNGESHFANREAPSVPEDLGPLVAGFRGLNDFTPKPFYRRGAGRPIKLRLDAAAPTLQSDFPGVNILAPDDLAAIYNIRRALQERHRRSGASHRHRGRERYRHGRHRIFSLGVWPPIPRSPKDSRSGQRRSRIRSDAMGEADLDLEWSGAVARNATLFYVYSTDAFLSALYAIDQALAPVLSLSFGECELRASQNEAAVLEAESEKAAVEGITWIAASGDAGAAGCENQNAGFTSAITRMNPDLPASLPYVTGVGGSEFNEGSGAYLSNTLGPNGGSALGYIPEGGWTDESFIIANNLAVRIQRRRRQRDSSANRPGKLARASQMTTPATFQMSLSPLPRSTMLTR